MKRTLQLLSLILFLLLLGGCVSKHYRVTPEIYRERVKILGVLPLMVDAESTILHPQRQEVVELLRVSAQDKYLQLSDQLAASAGYSAVRPVIIDAQSQAQLFAGQAVQSSKAGTWRRYQPSAEAVATLARTAGVDGLLVVILNGVENKGKRTERSLGPRYLEDMYNEIQATAMVLSASGEVLWERPGANGEPFLDLQYPDFDEAYHNRTDVVAVRFITTAGLSRALAATEKGLFDKEAFPILYRRLFDSLADGLAVGKLWRK